MTRKRSVTLHDCGELQRKAAAGNVVAQDFFRRARLRITDDDARQDERNRLLCEMADVVWASNPGLDVRPVAFVLLAVWKSQPLRGLVFARMTEDEIAWLKNAAAVLHDLEPAGLCEKSVRHIIGRIPRVRLPASEP